MAGKRGEFGTRFAVVLLAAVTANTAAASDHWVIGCWDFRAWGGVCFQPDGTVYEVDPEGLLTDVGIWGMVGDNGVVWQYANSRTLHHLEYLPLADKAQYSVDFGYGPADELRLTKKTHIPEQWQTFEILGYDPDGYIWGLE